MGHKDFLETSASSTVSEADKSVSGLQDLAEGSEAESVTTPQEIFKWKFRPKVAMVEVDSSLSDNVIFQGSKVLDPQLYPLLALEHECDSDTRYRDCDYYKGSDGVRLPICCREFRLYGQCPRVDQERPDVLVAVTCP